MSANEKSLDIIQRVMAKAAAYHPTNGEKVSGADHTLTPEQLLLLVGFFFSPTMELDGGDAMSEATCEMAVSQLTHDIEKHGVRAAVQKMVFKVSMSALAAGFECAVENKLISMDDSPVTKH